MGKTEHIGPDKMHFKEWLMKLKNCFYQTRPGQSQIKLWDRADEVGREHAANNGGWPTTIIPRGTVTQDEIRNISEDLYAVLIYRTDREVNGRLIGTYERAKGDVNLRGFGGAGLRAYFDMYAWFMKTTGLR